MFQISYFLFFLRGSQISTRTEDLLNSQENLRSTVSLKQTEKPALESSQSISLQSDEYSNSIKKGSLEFDHLEVSFLFIISYLIDMFYFIGFI